MDFKLNNFSIEDHERGKMMEMEQLGNQIVAALTGMPGNAGMYGNPGMQQNAGMYGNPGMQQNADVYGNPGMQQNADMYGNPGMQYHTEMYGNVGVQRCSSCGWVQQTPGKISKFCPECGSLLNME